MFFFSNNGRLSLYRTSPYNEFERYKNGTNQSYMGGIKDVLLSRSRHWRHTNKICLNE